MRLEVMLIPGNGTVTLIPGNGNETGSNTHSGNETGSKHSSTPSNNALMCKVDISSTH